ncbi:MAG: dephospho-CoA kinase [Candidatus Bipolaricaulaceae bacterium]
MRVIGLAGPAGTGKSTVARMLARRPGFTHVDCDALAWDTYRPGGPAYLGLVARFGREILNPDGTVNRTKLGALAFSNPRARKDLEDLVHPWVMEALRLRAAEEKRKGTQYLLVEGALLLHSPHVDRDFFDLFLWFSVPEEERRRRLREAGLSERLIEERLSAQMDLVPPLLPNLIVVNGEGAPAEVAQRVLRVIHAYFQAAPTSS